MVCYVLCSLLAIVSQLSSHYTVDLWAAYVYDGQPANAFRFPCIFVKTTQQWYILVQHVGSCFCRLFRSSYLAATPPPRPVRPQHPTPSTRSKPPPAPPSHFALRLIDVVYVLHNTYIIHVNVKYISCENTATLYSKLDRFSSRVTPRGTRYTYTTHRNGAVRIREEYVAVVAWLHVLLLYLHHASPRTNCNY